MTKKRIYTHVSEKAVRGFQRLAATKHVYVMPVESGEFTVVTVDKPKDKRRVAEAA